LAFLQETISTYPPLTPEEERQLFLKLEKNPQDEETRERIVLSNLRLIIHWAIKEFALHGLKTLSVEDLIQEGVTGLIDSSRYFEVRKGYKFSTYATYLVRQRMHRAIQNSDSTIRVPVYRHSILAKFARASRRLSFVLERDPRPEEIAEAMAVPLEEVFKIFEIFKRIGTTSLDASFTDDGDDHEHNFLNVLNNGDGEEGQKEAETNERNNLLIQTIEDSIEKPRDKEILLLRFGLEGNRPLTLEEIGKKYGITRERVRQIEARGLRLIKRVLDRNPKLKASLKEFW